MKKIIIVTVCLISGYSLAAPLGHSPFEEGKAVEKIPLSRLQADGERLSPDTEVFSGDLNRDGRQDLCVYTWLMGCGMNAGLCEITFFLSSVSGRARQTVLTMSPDEDDFVILNGRPCMVQASFHQVEQCNDGKPHSFYVYNLLEFGLGGLRLNNELDPAFPKIVWISHSPNSMETGLLSMQQKRDLYELSCKELPQ